MPGGGVTGRLVGAGGWSQFRLLRAWGLGSEGCIPEERALGDPSLEGHSIGQSSHWPVQVQGEGLALPSGGKTSLQVPRRIDDTITGDHPPQS